MNAQNAHSPEVTLLDLEVAKAVEVFRTSENRLYVNVDGKCLLRIQKSDYLNVSDSGDDIGD